jgi:MFS family permease
MAVSRALYITFYVLYLVTLSIALWFILDYSKVDAWVWSFFAIAFGIVIVGVLIKEFAMKASNPAYAVWGWIYVIAHFIAVGFFLTGLILTISQSTIPWWVWVILGIAVLLPIIATIITAYAEKATAVAAIIGLAGFILFIVGLIFLVIESDAPWWIWLIIGVAITFCILAVVFEAVSVNRNPCLIVECPATESQPTQPLLVVTEAPKSSYVSFSTLETPLCSGNNAVYVLANPDSERR